ncbi:natural resistance-associated macrophage protein-domain-containing protein [Melampsora americana]|nr:natural resistance-associated macrophage protein-domain-containing protein [Melampsora americana]
MTINLLNQPATLHNADDPHSIITSTSIWARTIATKIAGVLKRHSKFVGPGVVASVSFYDPGNVCGTFHCSVLHDVLHFELTIPFIRHLFKLIGYNSGQQTYKLVQSLETLIFLFYSVQSPWQVFLQVLACRLGFISGKGFADIGQLLGSAIAYNLLIPKIPIWGCILLSFPDVFLALIFFRKGKQSARSFQLFEIVISMVVMSVVVASLILLFKVNPDWGLAFRGFLPSSKIVEGATIGPHAIILGSNLATVEREDAPESEPEIQRKSSVSSEDSEMTLCDRPPLTLDFLVNHVSTNEKPEMISRKSKDLKSFRSHLSHATFDIAASLFTLPLIINSAILIVASTSFFYTTDRIPIEDTKEANIQSIHTLLNANLGPAVAGLFAFSLFLSGQAASLTITMAGQSLSSGFLGWETNALLRRLVTRTVGIIPSVIIAVLLGRKGINMMLIASQVAISLVLPFAIIPLAYFTSKTSIMTIKFPQDFPLIQPHIKTAVSPHSSTEFSIDQPKKTSRWSWFQQYYQKPSGHGKDIEVQSNGINPSSDTHSFVNSLFTKLVTISVICIIILADSYAIAKVVESYRINLVK